VQTLDLVQCAIPFLTIYWVWLLCQVPRPSGSAWVGGPWHLQVPLPIVMSGITVPGWELALAGHGIGLTPGTPRYRQSCCGAGDIGEKAEHCGRSNSLTTTWPRQGLVVVSTARSFSS
jgi:hypothetical protein